VTSRDQVLFLGGRSGVGKSSVAAEVFRQLSLAGVRHCLIDGDNLDMAFPKEQGLNLAELNLAAMWANYQGAGYSRLVYVNTASVRDDVLPELLIAMGGEPKVNAVLLTASDRIADARLAQREIGGGLDAHVERGRRGARELEERAPDWVRRIATDGRTVAAVAAEIVSLLDWEDARPTEGGRSLP
jgi:Adenylylsulphate kinase